MIMTNKFFYIKKIQGSLITKKIKQIYFECILKWKNYKFEKSCELLEDHVDFWDSGRQVASLIFF